MILLLYILVCRYKSRSSYHPKYVQKRGRYSIPYLKILTGLLKTHDTSSTYNYGWGKYYSLTKVLQNIFSISCL